MKHAWLVATTVAASSVVAQSPEPRPAYSRAAAYDPVRQRLVLFGGFSRGGYNNETWAWDGRSWTLTDTTGPSARNWPQMAWDARRRVLVLFGGDTRQGRFGDTWEFDGTRWRLVAGSGPPPRTGHRLAYAASSGSVILFGGSDGDVMLNDTWSWDGTTWRRVAESGPSPRSIFAMSEDPSSGGVLLFGGTPALRPDAELLGDTWRWNGQRWEQLHVPGPGARDHAQMAADPANRRVVLHSGGSRSGPLDDTWSWDGRAWTRIATGPSRAAANMYFDSSAGAVGLFGGFAMGESPNVELWLLRGTEWSKVR